MTSYAVVLEGCKFQRVPEVYQTEPEGRGADHKSVEHQAAARQQCESGGDKIYILPRTVQWTTRQASHAWG